MPHLLENRSLLYMKYEKTKQLNTWAFTALTYQLGSVHSTNKQQLL